MIPMVFVLEVQSRSCWHLYPWTIEKEHYYYIIITDLQDLQAVIASTNCSYCKLFIYKNIFSIRDIWVDCLRGLSFQNTQTNRLRLGYYDDSEILTVFLLIIPLKFHKKSVTHNWLRTIFFEPYTIFLYKRMKVFFFKNLPDWILQVIVIGSINIWSVSSLKLKKREKIW